MLYQTAVHFSFLRRSCTQGQWPRARALGYFHDGFTRAVLYARRDVRACYRALARSHIKTLPAEGVYCTSSPHPVTSPLPTHPLWIAMRDGFLQWGGGECIWLINVTTQQVDRDSEEKDAQWGSYKTLYYYYESHLGVYLFSVLRGYYSLASFVTSRLLKASKNLAKIRIQRSEVEFFKSWWNITFLHFTYFQFHILERCNICSQRFKFQKLSYCAT